MTDPSNENVDRFFAKLSYIVIGFTLAFLGLLVYWGLEDATITKPQGNHIELVTKEAKAGETVTLLLSYCKEIDDPFTFTRSFVTDSTEISTPALIEASGKGCVNNRKVLVPVPPQIGTGTYRIKYTLRAQINPIKETVEEHWSDPVRIIGLE